MVDWFVLKSGSDIRGTAVGDGTILTDEVARTIGMAFALFLSEKRGKPVDSITVSLGRDSRVSGPALLSSAAEGIVCAGGRAVDYGLCTTPAMYMSTITEGFKPDGAIMVTASHHPWNKNGLKFFTEKGGLESDDIANLLNRAQTLKPGRCSAAERIIKEEFLPVYMNQLAERICSGLNTESEKPLSGLHIVVDAGNGAGGFYADLLRQLGANTEGSQFLEPDGRFPNHIPNPENTEAMQSVSKAVINAGADLGVIFDADCDRAAIVDSKGNGINRNRLIALISAVLLSEEKGLTIVTDSVTSSGLSLFIRSLGGDHYRFKRGYRNVIDEAIRLNKQGINCPLAIETSGHAALRENHFLDDGMYLVTLLIARALQMKKEGRELGSLIDELNEPVESQEIRIRITEQDFQDTGKEAIRRVAEYAESNPDWHILPDNREGIRVSFNAGGHPDACWFLLRLSVHDPVLPLNLESDVKGGIRMMINHLYNILKDLKGIDLSEIRKENEEAGK